MNNWQDISIFWNEVKKTIANNVSEQEFTMWFDQLSYIESTESSLTLSVPSTFYKDRIKDRYLELIKTTFFQLSGRQIDIHFKLQRAAPSKKKSSVSTKKATVKKDNPFPKLFQERTFETFIIGDNNNFAANAAIAIAQNPGTTYNPMLIYGRVGLGKTHLLQAIGNKIWETTPNTNIKYITAENFTNEFIRSIQEKKTHVFKTKYRSADVLLIDDIHFLHKKYETQEELFHTFNALFNNKKQIVFTSDRPITEIKDITERLQTRVSRGLNVDLQPPKTETAIAILKKKMETLNTHISDEIITLICQKITTNVRDLESALTRIVAYTNIVKKEITPEIAKQQLEIYFSNSVQKTFSVDLIQRIVAEHYNLSSNDLKGKKRNRQIAFPRQLAMYISRETTEASMTDIGLEFGGRDHTTVIHACQKIESRIQIDPTMEDVLNNLINLIKKKSNNT